MNCQKFEKTVGELTRDQITEASEREQALSHAAECEACGGRLHEERLLTSGLRELSAAMKLVPVPESLEGKLRAEFRNQTFSRIPDRRNSSLGRYWIYAAAAMLLLIGSIAVLRFTGAKVKQPEVVREVKQRNSNPAVATLSPKRVTAPIGNTPPAPRQKHSSKGAARVHTRSNATTVSNQQTVAANNTAREIATEFMPLGFSNVQSVQEGVQEGGQVIRVEMPRYAMSRFGLPVNMDRYDERVKADVLFSADGLARAIRFVQ